MSDHEIAPPTGLSIFLCSSGRRLVVVPCVAKPSLFPIIPQRSSDRSVRSSDRSVRSSSASEIFFNFLKASLRTLQYSIPRSAARANPSPNYPRQAKDKTTSSVKESTRKSREHKIPQDSVPYDFVPQDSIKRWEEPSHLYATVQA